MVLDEQALPLTRSWCIFELLQTLNLERSDEQFQGLLLCTVTGVLNTGNASVETAMNLARRISTLSLESASASNENDKDMINKQVLKQMGSFKAMEDQVCEHIVEILKVARQHSDQEFDT